MSLKVEAQRKMKLLLSDIYCLPALNQTVGTAVQVGFKKCPVSVETSHQSQRKNTLCRVAVKKGFCRAAGHFVGTVHLS